VPPGQPLQPKHSPLRMRIDGALQASPGMTPVLEAAATDAAEAGGQRAQQGPDMEQATLTDELARTRGQLDAALRELRHSEEERRQSREREAILCAELQHRLRNMLGIIRSVFSRTMETAASLDEAADHFRGRLDTVARHQSQFTRAPGRTVDLEALLRDELLTFGFSDGERVSIAGPAVRLPHEFAEMVGLAMHELATNSVKFGALGGDKGRLAIAWAVADEDGARRLALEWAESGVPVLASAPLRTGFGREFIEQALPYQIDATTSFDLRPGGLLCRINLALGDETEQP
jgi:two-component sensor histidine kinase